MSWGEAWRLFEELVVDPSSRVCAAIAGWAYPLSHEAQATLDLYDLTHKIAAGRNRKPKPHPRPWDRPKISYGKTTLPPDEARALLKQAARGPTA